MRTSNRCADAQMGTGEAESQEFPVGRIAATAALVGVTFAAIDVGKNLIESKLGKKRFPDFDIVLDGDVKTGKLRAKVRDKATTEEERAAIKAAKEEVRRAKKALKDAKMGDEKKDARKDLKKAERKLAELLDPDGAPEADEDDKDEEAAA